MEHEKKLEIILKLCDKYLLPLCEKGIPEFINSSVFTEYMMAPASYRKDYVGCYDGGLSELSLLTFKNYWHTINNMKYDKVKLGDKYVMFTSSVVKISLFSQLGKVGSWDGYKVNKYYYDRDEYGNFKVNNDLVNIPVSVRSIKILNDFDIKLSEAEYQAIMSINENGMTLNDYKEEALTTYLKTSHRMAIDMMR